MRRLLQYMLIFSTIPVQCFSRFTRKMAPGTKLPDPWWPLPPPQCPWLWPLFRHTANQPAGLPAWTGHRLPHTQVPAIQGADRHLGYCCPASLHGHCGHTQKADSRSVVPAGGGCGSYSGVCLDSPVLELRADEGPWDRGTAVRLGKPDTEDDKGGSGVHKEVSVSGWSCFTIKVPILLFSSPKDLKISCRKNSKP